MINNGFNNLYQFFRSHIWTTGTTGVLLYLAQVVESGECKVTQLATLAELIGKEGTKMDAANRAHHCLMLHRQTQFPQHNIEHCQSSVIPLQILTQSPPIPVVPLQACFRSQGRGVGRVNERIFLLYPHYQPELKRNMVALT